MAHRTWTVFKEVKEPEEDFSHIFTPTPNRVSNAMVFLHEEKEWQDIIFTPRFDGFGTYKNEKEIDTVGKLKTYPWLTDGKS